MTWLQRYRIRHFLRNSLWFAPVVAMLAAVVLIRLLNWLETEMHWQGNHDPDSVRAVLGNLAGAMFTFIVFVCSSLLLVVQLASAQLTPRIIGVLFRERITKLTLSMFVFTFAFAISALIRIEDSVPLLTVEISVYCSAVCLGMFLYLIDRVSKMLRPSGALMAVTLQAHDVIDSVYPQRLGKAPSAPSETSAALLDSPARTVVNLKPGVVLAFDVQGLMALAARHNCIIELAPQVGNFAAPGDPLFRIYGDADWSVDSLRQFIALGAERTMEQDPAFALRVVVDIASKGLSPAINDPTTAVLVIDQVHHLLRHIGNRNLDNAQVRDATGRVRLVYRTPDWDDFVRLAVTEIRQFGATSIQIARRLRAMLEDLIQTLREERIPLLRQELKLLQRSVESHFTDPEDRALAEVSDSQGVGGKPERSQRNRQVN
ncbi:MAG TPA: DUF2254 domain-containing protein [Gemmataceae bacterium]|nr:DUF2254 domain-containing protein [Gemmataceae bacterium]